MTEIFKYDHDEYLDNDISPYRVIVDREYLSQNTPPYIKFN